MSLSRDLTLYTADMGNKHFMFLWSAGELGLVMTLCETTAPAPALRKAAPLSPSVQTFPVPMDVVSSRLDTSGKMPSHAETEHFSPVGDWVGGYTCAQGYTGGTLRIAGVKGKNFEGVFRFYPTPRNRKVPPGSYTVYGQYDTASKRILINPGKWLERPKNFYNTVMVGSFDPMDHSFSAYFQGVSGCTSFEAKRAGEPYEGVAGKKVVKHVTAKKPKKKVAPKPPAAQSDNAPVATPADAAVPALTAPTAAVVAPTALAAAPAVAGVPAVTPPALTPIVPPAANSKDPGIILTAPPPASK